VAILDTEAPPVHQQIAAKAFQLQQLGMSDSAIARRLGVTDKTVAKAIAWLLEAQRPRSE
jgi:predicted transcriptional regulator